MFIENIWKHRPFVSVNEMAYVTSPTQRVLVLRDLLLQKLTRVNLAFKKMSSPVFPSLFIYARLAFCLTWD